MNTQETSNIARHIKTIAIILLLLMPLAALGSRFGLWHFRIGLLLMSIAMLGSLLIQIINAIWLLRKPAQGTKKTLRMASLYALPPLLVVAAVIRGSGNGPMIHNITTAPDDPPEFVAAINQRGQDSNPLAYTPDIADIQRKMYPDLAPVFSDLSKADAFAKAKAVTEQLGWDIYDSSEQQGRIEAVSTTLWFGFKDDIVIRVSQVENGSRIDLRSVSRVGKSDLGANAKRIKKFIERFNE